MRLRSPVDWLSKAWPFRSGSDQRARRSADQRRRTNIMESMDFSGLTLEEVLSLEPGLLATKLHIVSLRSFREMVGDDWERLSDRVTMIVDGVMRRFLGPKGLYTRHGDDTFVLGFSALPEEEGRRLAVQVVNELMHRLIGERFVGAQICLAELDLEDILDDDGALDLEALDAKIDAAEPVAVDAVLLPASPQAIDDVNWHALEPDEGPAQTRGAAVGQPDSTAKLGPRWVPLVWPPSVENRPSWAQDLAFSPRDALPDGIEIVFRPTWNTRWQAIDVYASLARRRRRDGRVVERGLLPRPIRPRQSANLDFALLHTGLSQLTVAIEERRGCLLIAPIRFATLQAPYWATIAGILRSVPDAMRMRYLMIEVTHIPKVANAEHMLGLAAMLRPLCRDVLARTDVRTPRFALLASLQPAAVGCDLSTLPADSDIPEALTAFAESAGRQRFYTFGINDRSALAAASILGARYINGEALLGDFPEPRGRIEFDGGIMSGGRPANIMDARPIAP